MNILANSVDAIEAISKNSWSSNRILQIVTRTERRESSIIISFTDNGVGMSDMVKAHIFDPFFTTKDVGKGTGMGMAVSYQIIVEKHRGKIERFSEEGSGTEFVIELPTRTDSA